MQEKFHKALLLCQIWGKSNQELTSIQSDAKILNKTDKKQVSKNQIKNSKNKKEEKKTKKQKNKNIYTYNIYTKQKYIHN